MKKQKFLKQSDPMELILAALFSAAILIPSYHTLFSEEVDPEFSVYVERFEAYHKEDVNINIKFSDIKDGYVGMCYPYSNLIEIDREFWDAQPDSTKEAAIFHELGHCVLGRDHVPDLDDTGCPVSLMYYELRPVCYQLFREKYIKELFDND